jgi:heat shock protein HtpX
MYLAHMAQWIGFMGSAHDDDEGRGLNPAALLLTVILAPIATLLIQTAVSRTREFLADETGAKLCRRPLDLASALKKISNPALVKKFQQQDLLPDMQPAFSHLYIVNHFSTESVLSLFSTHPPVEERVKRLEALGRAF